MKKTIGLLTSFLFCFIFMLASACALPNNGSSSESSAQQSSEEENRMYWGTLVGEIIENGEPLEGVKVTSGDEVVMTDEGGRYEIKVYNNGATVSFEKDGCITQRKTFKSTSFYTEKISYDFIMFIATKVEGTVVDGNGNAMENAIVTIGIQEVQTDADGYFCFDEVIGTSMILTVTEGNKTVKKPLYTEEMRTGRVRVEIVLE